MRTHTHAQERSLKVSEQHVWVSLDDHHVHLGLTNFGQSEIGEIISIELPEVGDKVERGEAFAELESVATAIELIAPVSGTILAVNGDIERHPSIINEDPYQEGWLIEVKVKDLSEIEPLMDMDEYYHFVYKSHPH